MRIILIILDGVGAGELPDAAKYNDSGSNTLGNCAQAVGGLILPNLERLGLGNILPVLGIKPAYHPLASYGKMAEASVGKDTITGHWEIAGLIQKSAFPLYPEGFPPEIIDAFAKAIGKEGVLWNKPASGTDLIQKLAAEHIKTGYPIVYTSADSVFQIAAHIDVTPLDKLYSMCRKAREILTGTHRVGRVIARPFGGDINKIHRVPGRADYSVPPPEPTLFNRAQDKNLFVVGIGKIGDIYAKSGLDKIIHTDNNNEGIDAIIKAMEGFESDIIVANLVDFDTLYGHRNDPEGFARALSDFDKRLPEIMADMDHEDILIITADHGCDPTTASTDHSREYVPLLIFGGMMVGGVNLGVRSTFADLGQTIAESYNLGKLPNGTSFWKSISKEAQGIASFT